MLQTPIERVGQGLVMMVKKIITAFSTRNNEFFIGKGDNKSVCLQSRSKYAMMVLSSEDSTP